MDQEEYFTSLIQKYMQGDISNDELETLFSLLENPSSNLSLRPALFNLWMNDKEPASANLENKETDNILSKVHHQINLVEKVWNTPISGLKKAVRLFSKIAAILILPVLIAGIWYYIDSRTPFGDTDAWVSVSSPMGTRIKTVLPDSTIIWQNAGSTIKYPRNYTKKNRQVMLNGEAFFDVKSNQLYPFYVMANSIQVKVTGTRFNVSSYIEDRNTSVILDEGKVVIQNLVNSQKNNTPFILTPGMCYSYNYEDNKTTVNQIDASKYISWKDGKLIFRNDPLSEVCIRLKRWYNAEIELTDNTGDLLSHPFTMTIETETLVQVLEYLCQAAPIEYEVKYNRKGDGSGLMKPKYIVKTK